MNDLELRELLDARSTPPMTIDAASARLAGVRGRVVARRRRQLVGGAVMLLVAMVGVTGLAWNVSHGKRLSQPVAATPSPSKVGAFPEYSDGNRMVVAASSTSSHRSVSVDYTPTRNLSGLWIYRRCDDHLWVKVTLNGKPFTNGTCGGGSGFSGTTLANYGAVAGKKLTATVTVVGSGDSGKGPVPQQIGPIDIGIALPVAFADYPLPPRPAVVPTLEVEPPGKGRLVIRAVPNEWTRPVTKTVRWQEFAWLGSLLQTPGSVELRINGHLVQTEERWEYSSSHNIQSFDNGWEKELYDLDLKAGQLVTLTATPKNVTGDWAFELEHDPIEEVSTN